MRISCCRCYAVSWHSLISQSQFVHLLLSWFCRNQNDSPASISINNFGTPLRISTQSHTVLCYKHFSPLTDNIFLWIFFYPSLSPNKNWTTMRCPSIVQSLSTIDIFETALRMHMEWMDDIYSVWIEYHKALRCSHYLSPFFVDICHYFKSYHMHLWLT